jgi:hypothetical protein
MIGIGIWKVGLKVGSAGFEAIGIGIWGW